MKKTLRKTVMCFGLVMALIITGLGAAGVKKTSAAAKVLSGTYEYFKSWGGDDVFYCAIYVKKIKGNKVKVSVEEMTCSYREVTGIVKNGKMLYTAKDRDGMDSKIKMSIQFQGKKLKCTLIPIKGEQYKKYTFTAKKKK
ncbi:MAG: hypothetical protein IJ733_01715 [Lachnospiraceae bacterium]|nr:hypothetical protein [Lachnospiraceae bacterium]